MSEAGVVGSFRLLYKSSMKSTTAKPPNQTDNKDDCQST